METSTHVDGNEITAQSKENKDRNEITAQSEQISDNKVSTVQMVQCCGRTDLPFFPRMQSMVEEEEEARDSIMRADR